MTQEDIIQTTLKDSNYHLSIVTLRNKIVIKESKSKKTPFVTCIIRDKDIQLKPEEQRLIQEKITESFNLRKQSKQLLECAKRAVEIAIEKNEDTAIKWLQKQTKEAAS
jgi:hypothetical protein